MDERIETFMRDVASDEGLELAVVGDNARKRLADHVRAVRTNGAPETANNREQEFRQAIVERVANELDQYRGTNKEAHLLRVLMTVRSEV